MQTIHAYKDHLFTLLQLAWPNVVTNFLSLAIPLSSTLAVGRSGPSRLLGAAALGGMFSNATGFATGNGLAMALDTLCSQAYGAKKYKLVGLHTQRAIIILTLISIPLSILWWFSGYLLRFISDEETAQLSELWVRILIPSMWPRFMCEAYRRHLLGQRVVWPITVSNVLVVPVHCVATYLFTFHFGWGFSGAAWAATMSAWLTLITLVAFGEGRVIYLRRKTQARGSFEMLEVSESEKSEAIEKGETEKDEEDNGDPLHTWPAWGVDSFTGWGQFLRLGWATAVSLVIEWGSFEVNAVIASKLGELELSTHAILSYLAGVWYTPPQGIAAAATSLVGNMIGAGRPTDAAMFAKIGFTLELIYAVANGVIGQLYKHSVGRLFTDDEAVIEMTSNMLLVLAIYAVFDATKCIGVGILRGSGRPTVTVYGNVLSCMFIGYPVALLLVFKANMGLQGLWLGMTAAWFIVSVLCLVVMSRTNWEKEVQNAQKRNEDALMSTSRRKSVTFSVTFDEEKENKLSMDDSASSSVVFISAENDSPAEDAKNALTA